MHSRESESALAEMGRVFRGNNESGLSHSLVDIRLVRSRGSFYPDVLFRGSSMEQIKFKMKLELAASVRQGAGELSYRRAQSVIVAGLKC